MPMVRIISCLLILPMWISVHAQSYYFRHFEVENGLSYNTVQSIIQDHNGFMWFGTKDGLCRFDGYHFKTFHITRNDKNALSRDNILSLAIDSSNRLWVGEERGLYWFDVQTEQLVLITDTLHWVSHLTVGKDGQLWFLSVSGICRYSAGTKKVSVVVPPERVSATALCIGQDGTLWFATKGYLWHCNTSTGIFHKYDVFSHSPAANSEDIFELAPDKDSSLFLGTASQGLKQFSMATSDYTDLVTHGANGTSLFVRDILLPDKNEVWLATESGVLIFDRATGKAQSITRKYLDPYALSDNAIYALCRDKEGGIWVGTYFGGVNYLASRPLNFEKYFPDNSGQSISGNAVREICQDSTGDMWIGTEDAGLNKLDPVTQKITHFLPGSKPGSISYSNIHGLVVVKDKLWMGTFFHGIDVMDIKTGKVDRHYTAGNGAHDLKSNFVSSLSHTKEGTIYIGSSAGLFKYNAAKDNFDAIGGLTAFVTCMLEDTATGTIWVGTIGNGLYLFDPSRNEVRHYENDLLDPNISLMSITSICKDSHDNFWITTDGNGLWRFSRGTAILKRYTLADGFPSNISYKVLEDRHGALWVTTSRGLVNMNISSGAVTVYTKADGLLNDQFNYNSGYRDPRGRLYFGSTRGMISFDPSSLHKSLFIPPVFITGLQVNNTEVNIGKDDILKKSILLTDEITLAHDQSSFSVDFAALGYTDPEKIDYSYKMEGVDDHWNMPGGNRKVYFTDLKPGRYTFRVRASVPHQFDTPEKELQIEILPPLWATKWAWLVYFLAVTSVSWFFLRSYYAIQKSKKAKAMIDAKMTFLTNVTHEIRTPLTLIRGPVDNLREMTDVFPEITEDVKTLEKNTQRLMNLVDQVLDFRQTEIRAFTLHFSLVDITELLKETYETFEPLAQKGNLNYLLEIPAMAVTTMADKEALNKIFTNLLSNAVKYAEGRVNILLTMPGKEDNSISIEVKNDGPLIPAEMAEKIFEPFFRLNGTKTSGTGIGLALARSLAELHKGTLSLRQPAEGENVFVLRIPLNHKSRIWRRCL